MKTSDTGTKSETGKRKAKLSPELQELLHMLSSIEARLDTAQAAH